jgi:hypothetical protein
MGTMKMAMGEMGLAIVETLQPALMGLANGVKAVATWIKEAVHWFHEHESAGKAVRAGVVAIAVALGAYQLQLKAVAFWTATATARGVAMMLINGVLTGEITVLTAAQWLWNAALTANPIGLVVVAIGALIAGVVYAWNEFVTFRAVVIGAWGVIKEFGSIVGNVFAGVWRMIQGVFNFDPKAIAGGWEQAAGAMGDAGKRMATAYKEGYNGVMAEDKANKEKEAKEKSALSNAGKTAGTTTATAVTGKKEKKDISPKGATGSKSVTINISIGKLIEQFKVQTNTMGEGVGKVREMVAQSLLSAINDSQITAGI